MSNKSTVHLNVSSSLDALSNSLTSPHYLSEDALPDTVHFGATPASNGSSGLFIPRVDVGTRGGALYSNLPPMITLSWSGPTTGPWAAWRSLNPHYFLYYYKPKTSRSYKGSKFVHAHHFVNGSTGWIRDRVSTVMSYGNYRFSEWVVPQEPLKPLMISSSDAIGTDGFHPTQFFSFNGSYNVSNFFPILQPDISLIGLMSLRYGGPSTSITRNKRGPLTLYLKFRIVIEDPATINNPDVTGSIKRYIYGPFSETVAVSLWYQKALNTYNGWNARVK